MIKKMIIIVSAITILLIFTSCTVSSLDDLPTSTTIKLQSDDDILFYKTFDDFEEFQNNRFQESSETGMLYFTKQENELLIRKSSFIESAFNSLLNKEKHKMSESEAVEYEELIQKFVCNMYDSKTCEILQMPTNEEAITFQNNNLKDLFTIELFDSMIKSGYCNDLIQKLYEANTYFLIDSFFAIPNNIVYSDNDYIYLPICFSLKSQSKEFSGRPSPLSYAYDLCEIGNVILSYPNNSENGIIDSDYYVLIYVDIDDPKKICRFDVCHDMCSVNLNGEPIYVFESFSENGIEKKSDYIYYDYEVEFLNMDTYDQNKIIEVHDQCIRFIYSMYDGISYKNIEQDGFDNLKSLFTTELNEYLESVEYFDEYYKNIKKYEAEFTIFKKDLRSVSLLKSKEGEEVICVVCSFEIDPFIINVEKSTISGDALEFFQYFVKSEDVVFQAKQLSRLMIYFKYEDNTLKICNWSGTVRREK